MRCSKVCGRFLVGVAAAWVSGGVIAQLDPPAGPIVKTGKTLVEIEPRIAVNSTNTPGDADSMFKITAPGSYYLTGNIAGLVGKHGIEIEASGVTLDLNGFVIRGLGTISGAFDGVFTPFSADRVTVRNGHVELMGRGGINLGQSSECVVEGVTAYLCQGTGIEVGRAGRITECTSSSNQVGIGNAGIRAGDNSLIERCVAESNAGIGIIVGFGGVVKDCVTRDNDNTGITVVALGVVSGSVAYNSGTIGIGAGSGSVVTDCKAIGSGTSGFSAAGGSVLTRCSAEQSDVHGIKLEENATAVDCFATSNQQAGIVADGDGTVRGCTLSSNQGSGILVSGNQNRIEGNHCTENGIGIDVDGSDNTIEGNSCVGNPVNFDIDGTGNLVIKNMARGGSPNYSIVAGNSVAPRIGVVGSDGWAGIANANHPWANLGY
ncbi:MAG: right-handed parallel beta-helix repeat-containing protein [Phycisphaerales bacterium]